MRKETIIACFIVLSRYIPKVTEENYENVNQLGRVTGRVLNLVSLQCKIHDSYLFEQGRIRKNLLLNV
jgi:hypothetical protein